MRPDTSSPLLLAEGLVREFELPGGALFSRKKILRAVSEVSFSIGRREVLGLVGESGSGKTTIGRLVMRLLPPTRGRILFDGIDLTALSGGALRSHRRRFQMVFQDPYASLNPRMRVREIVEEPLVVHGIEPGKGARRERVAHLLERVGLSARDMERLPREFSGGGRQRIGIARAIACGPELLVADEPIASLDLSMGAQIINLFSSLVETEGMSLLFISHDIPVVRYLSDRVAVLYRGSVVESGPTEKVFSSPRHPYTRLLTEGSLSAEPSAPSGELRSPDSLASSVSAGSVSAGEIGLCAFLPRCGEARPECRILPPPLYSDGEGGREALCHLLQGEIAWLPLHPSNQGSPSDVPIASSR
ncbi:MAG: oligopeptide/dipeptide ABC transporter ATP-binding protein [Leptospirales bacterium]